MALERISSQTIGLGGRFEGRGVAIAIKFSFGCFSMRTTQESIPFPSNDIITTSNASYEEIEGILRENDLRRGC
jgi:hypothetical protein